MLEVIIILLEVISRLLEMVAGYTTRESVMPMMGFTLSLVVVLCSLAAALRPIVAALHSLVAALRPIAAALHSFVVAGAAAGGYLIIIFLSRVM